jgi:hypothetical protein
MDIDEGDHTQTPGRIHNVQDREQRHVGRQDLTATCGRVI